MCNTCAQAVHTVSKNRGNEHKLYAASTQSNAYPVLNPRLSTTSTHFLTHYLSTQKRARANLLSRPFSTLYTGPITKTISNLH